MAKTTKTHDRPEQRRQTPEDTIARIAGVPRSADELEDERQALEQERVWTYRKNLGGLQPTV